MKKIIFYVIPIIMGVAISSIPAISFAQVGVSTNVSGTIGVGSALTDGVSSSIASNGSSNASATAPIVITRISAAMNASSTASTTAVSPTSVEIQTRAKTLIDSDTKLDSVSISPEQVSMTYREPAKLLGFIGARVPIEATIKANGQASVHYPWYSFLFSTNQAGLSIAAQGIANDVANTTASSSTGAFSLDTQAQLITSLHTILSSSGNE